MAHLILDIVTMVISIVAIVIVIREDHHEKD